MQHLLFFQLECECLLHGYIPNQSQDIICKIATRGKEGQNLTQSQDHNQHPLRYQHLTLCLTIGSNLEGASAPPQDKLVICFFAAYQIYIVTIIINWWRNEGIPHEDCFIRMENVSGQSQEVPQVQHNQAHRNKTNDDIAGENDIALGSVKHGYNPFPACKSNMELINTPSIRNKQLNTLSSKVDSNCGCNKPSCCLIPNKLWHKLLFWQASHWTCLSIMKP